MVRDQVLVVTEKGESETDAGIVIAASVSGQFSLPLSFPSLPCLSFSSLKYSLKLVQLIWPASDRIDGICTFHSFPSL